MKKFVFLFGFSPFLFGGLLNFFIINYPNLSLRYLTLIGSFLLLWGGFGFLSNKYIKSLKESIFILNLPSCIVLVYLVFQI